ncbi:MAG TPA: hypothetical protein VI278_04995 [Nitrososphaeraceae archaeon]
MNKQNTKRRILVVDDEPAYAKQWCRGLAAKSVFTADALEQRFGLLSLMCHWYVKDLIGNTTADCVRVYVVTLYAA